SLRASVNLRAILSGAHPSWQKLLSGTALSGNELITLGRNYQAGQLCQEMSSSLLAGTNKPDSSVRK
ncbi:hypothetical protein BgiBS90_011797, partial [Biomphalaria glabrata]